MKVLVIAIIVGGFSGLVSCEKDHYYEEIQDVYGGWILYATSGGFSGGYYPIDENSIKVAITEGGDYFEYHYDVLVAEEDFEIVKVEGSDGNDDQYFIEFTGVDNDDFYNHLLITLNGTDSLTLSPSCADCMNFHYVRSE